MGSALFATSSGYELCDNNSCTIIGGAGSLAGIGLISAATDSDGTSWILSPLESLKIYNRYSIHEYSKKNKIRIYTPNLIKNKVEKSKYKPGFYEQLKTIIEQDKKITNDEPLHPIELLAKAYKL